jgi:GntR family transcriptional repressor for pyruvate dehydrogenase complex
MFGKIISLLEDQSVAKNTRRIKEILEFRSFLEPEIAACAAQSLEPGDLALLKSILERQEKSLSEGKDDAEDDLHFHLTLARATKNEIIVEVVAIIHDILKECRVAPLENLTRKRISLQGHQKIYAALQDRNSGSSRTAMLNHLKEVDSMIHFASKSG